MRSAGSSNRCRKVLRSEAVSVSDQTKISEPRAGKDRRNGSAYLNLGRFMVFLAVVNPPFWASIVRGLTRDVVLACAVFSGLMIVFGLALILVGRSRIAR